MAENQNRTGTGMRTALRRIWRFLRWPFLALGLVIAVPLIAVPSYWVIDPVSTPMMGRMLTGERVVREWRDIDEISDRLKVSVMLSEDGQFCRHWGVDPGALRAEIQRLMRGEDVRGASTITMQVARNLFLWRGRSLVRKALEIPLAMYIDLVLSKRRIMEIYLNIAEWGPEGEFGIEAGVQRAFGIDSDALSWERASLMAVTLPNPLVRNPARPTSGLRRVSEIIRVRAQTYAERAGCLFGQSGPDL